MQDRRKGNAVLARFQERGSQMTQDRMRSMLAVVLLAGVALLVSAMPAGAADPSAGNEWEFDGNFYVWMPSIDAGLQNGGDISIPFETILEDLDMIFMAGVGVSKGKWWFKTDVIYFDISQRNNGLVTIPGRRRDIDFATSSRVEMEAWIVTPSVGYKLVDAERGTLDVFAGARYLWLDVELKLKTVGPLTTRSDRISDSGSVWDGIVGFRGYVDFGPNVFLPYYADVGGGESDLTWQAFAGAGWRFKHVDAIVGWRYLEYKFKGSSPVLEGLTVNGPQIGVTWKF